MTILFVASILLMFVGSLSGSLFHSSNGDVEVTDIQFVTEDGAELRAILYVPDSVDVDNPSPGVIANHGYNNTAELQSINAIELSRRGMVVMSVDSYGHGQSTFPSAKINEGHSEDMGAYAALQYLGDLPYVDENHMGMVGHSMGSENIQWAALKAFEAHEDDSSITVPHALLPTSNAFLTNEEQTELMYADYPVNIGVVYGQYDEWADGMWGVAKGSNVNQSPKAEAGMGFAEPDYNTYYHFGEKDELSENEALDAAADKNLRVMYSPPIDHPKVHFSKRASEDVINFFDLTLMQGDNPLTASNQIWFGKEASTGLALIGFLLFIPTFGLLLLNIPFFKKLIRPEPESISVIKSSKDKVIYWVLLMVSLIPAPFIYMWATGYPIAMKSSGRVVPTVLPVGDFFQMPTMNGLVVFNLLAGLVAILLFIAVYFLLSKKQGVTLGDIGVKLPFAQIGKALLLAIIVFSSAYALLAAADYWFLTDFRFYVFSFKTITPVKVGMLLKYLPFFAFYFIISSLTFNLTTRIKGAKEWQNILLILLASAGSLYALWALDYISLYTTGIKMFLTVPFPAGTTSALAGVLLWGLLFILPIAAIYARIFFKRTGSIWVGGFINSFIVTFFAMSNTVVGAGML